MSTEGIAATCGLCVGWCARPGGVRGTICLLVCATCDVRRATALAKSARFSWGRVWYTYKTPTVERARAGCRLTLISNLHNQNMQQHGQDTNIRTALRTLRHPGSFSPSHRTPTQPMLHPTPDAGLTPTWNCTRGGRVRWGRGQMLSNFGVKCTNLYMSGRACGPPAVHGHGLRSPERMCRARSSRA